MSVTDKDMQVFHAGRGFCRLAFFIAAAIGGACDPPTLRSTACTRRALYAADDALAAADDEASMLLYADLQGCKSKDAKVLAAPAAAGAALVEQAGAPVPATLSAFVETRGTSAYAIDVLARRFADTDAYDALCGEILSEGQPALALRCFGYRRAELDAERGLAAYAGVESLRRSDVAPILNLSPTMEIAPLRRCFAEGPDRDPTAMDIANGDDLAAVAAKLSRLSGEHAEAVCLRRISSAYCLLRAKTDHECPEAALNVLVESLLDDYEEPEDLAEVKALLRSLGERADEYEGHPPFDRTKKNLLDLHRRVTIANAQLAGAQLAQIGELAGEDGVADDEVAAARRDAEEVRQRFVCLASEITRAMELHPVTLERYLDPELGGVGRCQGKTLTFSRKGERKHKGDGGAQVEAVDDAAPVIPMENEPRPPGELPIPPMQDKPKSKPKPLPEAKKMVKQPDAVPYVPAG